MFEFNLISGQMPLVAMIGMIAQIWYSVPLIIAISLVWGATRHERLSEIVAQSIRSLLWVLTFMGIIFAVIYCASFLQ